MIRDGAGAVGLITEEGSPGKQAAMSAEDQVKNAGQDTKGTVKEEIGKAAGDTGTEAGGKADQAAVGVKRTGEKAKDTASDALDELRAKVDEDA